MTEPIADAELAVLRDRLRNIRDGRDVDSFKDGLFAAAGSVFARIAADAVERDALRAEVKKLKEDLYDSRQTYIHYQGIGSRIQELVDEVAIGAERIATFEADLAAVRAERDTERESSLVPCEGCYVGGPSSEPDGYTVKLEYQVWGSYDRTEDYPKKPLCRLCRGKRFRSRGTADNSRVNHNHSAGSHACPHPDCN